MAQKAGQAYSQANVQASIAALEKNGGFNKVQVNVIPDPSGLRLNFILEPPYYLGMIEFPGVDKYFPYTRLLQVVNLPDEDPYDKARIPGAEAEFLSFLQKNGYFQAQVRAESQIDDANLVVAGSTLPYSAQKKNVPLKRLVGADPGQDDAAGCAGKKVVKPSRRHPQPVLPE